MLSKIFHILWTLLSAKKNTLAEKRPVKRKSVAVIFNLKKKVTQDGDTRQQVAGDTNT